MKKLSYVWQIVRNLLFIAVLLGAFSKASTGFETVVIAGIVIILLTLTGFMRIWGISQGEFLSLYMIQQADIKKLLNEEFDESEREAIKKHNKQKEDDQKKVLINSVFDYIAYLIALFALLVTLLT